MTTVVGGTTTGLVEAAVDVAATAGRYAAAAERDRQLDERVSAHLAAAGFLRHFVPRRFGGAEGTATEFVRAVATVATACPSAAWCGSLAAGAARMGAYLPDQGQRELWAQGPNLFVAGALIPSGTAERVAEGWRVRGEWEFTSGVDHADWALACARVPAGGRTENWFLALPRTEFAVRDTWSPVGMRGTGSNTLVVDDVVVPDHRGFPQREMLAGHSVNSTARCHTVPLRVLSGLLFAAPVWGAARGAVRAWAAHHASRSVPEAVAGPVDERAALVLSEAAAGVDAAGLLLQRAATVADRDSVPPTDAARNPRDCAVATNYLVEAVECLFRAVGTRGQSPSVPLERFWRDVHGMASHVALRFDTAGKPYGELLLSSLSCGREPGTTEEKG